jgi:hypothetical protein
MEVGMHGGGNWQAYLKESANRSDNLKIAPEALSKLLEIAFDLGHCNSYELRDQAIEEIFGQIQKGQEDPLVVMSLLELCSLPSGKKLFHTMFGEGTVVIKNNEKYVQFSGFRFELEEEGWPWTEKIKVLT